ncbi:hypothetical protein DVS28_a3430 [Euzebya pacifica]|uniref:Uncharacterized protein n=1 Tax=Euzebya pacifica TaxID=1608957 RepID=A0A346Y0V8_9ACTN|nr:hypothetical protein [Euzebya pacifica]AXV08105.1 hypothetical protein DVS28_a3430 [Euzebya pacifica]
MTVAHDDRTETDARRDTVTVDGTDTVADAAADTGQHQSEVPSRARSARARHIALKSHRALLESLLALPPTRTIDLADTERRTA